MFKDKKVLVTGSEGMIGKELVKLLEELGAEIYHFDLNGPTPLDVTDKKAVEDTFKFFEPEYVFHLFGIKGNPKRTKERPVDFMGPMLQGDTNMILASQATGVKRFLYTSSIAVKNQETDRYPAWAKMTGEILIDAMKIQYPETKYCVVRPANVYGKEDLNKDLMVVSSLIKQAKTGKLVLDIEGAKQTRDIIHAKDVARGMIKCMEEMPIIPVNLCSGKPTQIKDIAEEIANQLGVNIEYENLNLTLGPKSKVMDNPYIQPEIDLKEGIKLCLS